MNVNLPSSLGLTSHQLVSSMMDAMVNKEIHVDLTDEISFEELKATRNGVRMVASKKSKLFLCIAWSTLREIKLFKKIPRVIY